jgi:hypothetical protein
LGLYYMAPGPVGITYVAVTLGLLGFALCLRPFGRYEWALGVYTGVVTCLVAYILWWHLTGQDLVFL